MKKHFLDLFAGLGGASEAFVQDLDNWNVLRIDNNLLLQDVPHMVIGCVNHLANNIFRPNNIDRKIDVVWASPPCTEFSNGYNSPKSIASRTDQGLDAYEPDMTLLKSTMRIIEIVKPKYWIIENVVGSIRYFAEYLGEPRQIIGPYVLWGNFPYLDIEPGQVATKASKDVHSSNPLRANIKAKVDLSISVALKKSIECQTSILEFN